MLDQDGNERIDREEFRVSLRKAMQKREKNRERER
jgi:hypothetical protein